MPFNLPKKTINSFVGNEPIFTDNCNLLLVKYHVNVSNDISLSKDEIFFYLTNKSNIYEDFIKRKMFELKKEQEKKRDGKRNKLEKVLQEVNSIFERIGHVNINNNFSWSDMSEQFIKQIENSREKIFNAIGKTITDCNKLISKIATKKISLSSSTRLIVGLGSTSVLETSIKLHHIYGIPYIPSSAIKGVLRAYKIWELSDWNADLLRAFELAISKVFEKCKDPEKEFTEKLLKLDERELQQENKILIEKRDDIIIKQNQLFNILSIFGSQSNKGSLIVLDAYPEKFEGFDIDIMNPHYPEYYQGDEPPADWQNPNPIKFLAIPAGTKFNFYFLNPYQQLESDLKNSLHLIGIGAKTALGYGVFKK